MMIYLTDFFKVAQFKHVMKEKNLFFIENPLNTKDLMANIVTSWSHC